MYTPNWPALVVLGFCGQPALAQESLYFDPTILVTYQGQPRDLAWSGGINFAQFGQLDLDRDGLKDIVYFDRSGNTLRALRNTGGGGPANYEVSRVGLDITPLDQLHDWALFRDYDNDGDEDLFTYSGSGFAVYTNTSNGNTLSFERLTALAPCEYVFTDGTSLMTSLYTSSDDIPGLGDVDSDGDLDVLVFSQLGTYVSYYKNQSMENGHGADSLQFLLRSYCWGNFAENGSTNDVTLDSYCEFQVPDPEIGSEDQSAVGVNADMMVTHVGSTVTPIHLNGDGVMDLLLGDISYPNLVALINGGNSSGAHMIEVDEDFPSGTQPVNVPIFPAPYQLDIDGDDVLDLLVCPSARGLANNYEGVWYYKNNGTNSFPSFEYQQPDLFQGRMLDFGEGALPVLFDHDRDGDLDVVVANEGYYDPTGVYTGKLALLEQTSGLDGPVFDLVTTDYGGLSTSGIGSGMHPAFGDIDGDGDEDMYVGDLQGKIHYYRNVGGGGEAQFELVQANLTYGDGVVIDLGRFVSPLFVDLDEDGLLDLVAGEQNGNLNYLRNVGDSSGPEWLLVTDSLGGVRTNTPFTLGFSVPHFIVGEGGMRELLVGTESGTIWRYTGVVSDPLATWNLVDSAFHGIDEGYRSGIAVHDFTGDGVFDAILGNHRGGITFWRGDPRSAVLDRTPPTVWHVWPNPSAGRVNFVLPIGVSPNGTYRVHDAVGRLVHAGFIETSSGSLDLSGLPLGCYYLSYATPSSIYHSTSIVLGNGM